MAWCYTFGVHVGEAECREPMLVVEGEPRCACAACGTECEGLFPGCQTLVFAPGGLQLQLRALPPGVEPPELLRDVVVEEKVGIGAPPAPPAPWAPLAPPAPGAPRSRLQLR